ncbi:MAG: Gfo/Idh/MocA family protein [Candidatus Cyclobacteriaceae bacterium M3_2C_046]
MKNKKVNMSKVSRRKFILQSAGLLGSFYIVPRHVLGGVNYIAPSDKIVFGYIGVGKQVEGTLANAFLKIPEVQVVAGADVDAQKLTRFVSKVNDYYADQKGTAYKGCDAYDDFRALLARSDIDAVVIGTPDHWHAIPTVQAAKSGKDIYTEKPLSHTIEEGKAMVKAVKDHQRILQTGSMQRSWRDFRFASELVRNGYIGDIKKIKVTVGGPPVPCDLPAQPNPSYLDWTGWIGPAEMRPYHEVLSPPIEQNQWPRWRDYKEFGGGGMADWGAHMFDIAQWALGMDRSGPTQIIPPDGSQYQHLTYIYDNGVEMTHEDFGKGNAVRFEGSDGVIEVSRSFLNTTPESLQKVTIKPDQHLYVSDNHYQNFIDGIKTRKKTVADVETGHRTATICYLGNIAYELKRPLKWEPVKEQFINDAEANDMMSGPCRKPWNYYM